MQNSSPLTRRGNASTMNSMTPSSSQSSAALAMNSQVRMGQILDEQDHKRCSEGNHRALLAENLDQLRGLVKVLETDNWKYAASSQHPTHAFLPDSELSAPRW